MEIRLVPYQGETETAADLIIQFWQAHNGITPNQEDALADLADWTKIGHRLYFICIDTGPVGFVHLGSRGCEADWLEDLFVLPEHQGKGIGTRAIQLTEDIVREYSESLYIEVAARNGRALRLYRRAGYDCLNTVTVRKDFQPEKQEIIGAERILGMDFDVKKYRE